VIELFPSGVVATRWRPGSWAVRGLVAGSALIVDYVLTIAISVASGVDALFSLMPPAQQIVKLEVEIAIVALLIYLNLRGMRESIASWRRFSSLRPDAFLLIAYGIASHGAGLRPEVEQTIQETPTGIQAGGFVVLALFLKAFSLGGGTYTGIEAVSNNINMLKEPRVRTASGRCS